MTISRKILWVDNDPDYINVRSEFLEKAGYEVLRAFTLNEAEQLLQDSWVHLVVLDIRMQDDDDERDRSGLDWAYNERYCFLPKVIMTGFSRDALMRIALRARENNRHLAVDFLDKRIEPEEMIKELNVAFARHVRANDNLSIRWKINSSFVYLVSLIEPDKAKARISDWADELEDLFCRLFYDDNQIVITQLFDIGDKKVTLKLFAFSEEGNSREFVLTCGQRDVIREETVNYEKFAPKTIREGSTQKNRSAESIHFAAIAYTLTGADLEELSTLSEFYLQNSADMVIKVLDHLFDTTLAQWHQQGTYFEEQVSRTEAFKACLDISKEALTQSELEPRLRALQSKAFTNNLQGFDNTLLKQLFDLTEGSIPISAPLPLRYGVILKRLSGDNILVDHQGRTWLTDFSQVGQGPVVYDYISIENMVKFDLLNLSNLLERHKLEEFLQTDFSIESEIDFGDLASETRKAAQVITHIRQRFVDKVGHDVQHYQVGLLVAAIEKVASFEPTIFYTRLEIARYVHSLVSAKMLCQNLDLDTRAIEISLDRANKVLIIGEKQVELTKLEYNLLDFLEENSDKVCKRDDILKHLYGEHDYLNTDEYGLNSLISRLRKKIEPDPGKPRFIVTAQGHGYRFTR